MTTRDRLYKLIDELPENDLPAVERFLESRSNPVLRALMDAPLDDEPLSNEEKAAIAESRAAYERGEFVSHDELKRRLGL